MKEALRTLGVTLGCYLLFKVVEQVIAGALSHVVAGNQLMASDINGIIDQVNTNATDISTLQGQMTTAQGNITTLQGKVTTLQAGTFNSGLSVTGDCDISGIYKCGGNAILDGRGANTYVSASSSAVILTVGGGHKLQSNSAGDCIIPSGHTYQTGTP